MGRGRAVVVVLAALAVACGQADSEGPPPSFTYRIFEPTMSAGPAADLWAVHLAADGRTLLGGALAAGPGDRARATLWSVDGDTATPLADQPSSPDDDDSQVHAIEEHGGELVVAGSTGSGTDERPVVWDGAGRHLLPASAPARVVALSRFDDRLVAVGEATAGTRGPLLWWSDGPGRWKRAEAPGAEGGADVLTAIVSSPNTVVAVGGVDVSNGVSRLAGMRTTPASVAGDRLVSGVAWVSSDGASFERVALPGSDAAPPTAVVWTGQEFVAMGGRNDSTLVTWRSGDGRTWSSGEVPLPRQQVGSAVVLDGRIFAATQALDPGWLLVEVPPSGPPMALAAGSEVVVVAERPMAAVRGNEAVFVLPTRTETRLARVTGAGADVTTLSGVPPSRRDWVDNLRAVDAVDPSLLAIDRTARAGSEGLEAGTTGMLMAPDQPVADGTQMPFAATHVLRTATGWLAVVGDTSNPAGAFLFASSDGRTWEGEQMPNGGGWPYDVAALPGALVAAGRDSALEPVVWSGGPGKWTANSLGDGAGNAHVLCTRGSRATVLVARGLNGYYRNEVWQSEGADWKKTADFGSPASRPLACAMSEEEVVVVGREGPEEAERYGVGLAGIDATAWVIGPGAKRTDLRLPGPTVEDQMASDVAWFGGRFVAAGFDSALDIQGDAAVWTSTDGRNWERVAGIPHTAGRGPQIVWGVRPGPAGWALTGTDADAPAMWTVIGW